MAAVRVELPFLPPEVLEVLHLLRPGVFVLEVFRLVRRARVVRGKCLHLLISKGQAITPPVWQGSSMMVQRRAPGSMAGGGAFGLSMSPAPTRPSVSTIAFLCSTSPCPHCSRPRWCNVQVMPTGVGFLRTAVCMGAFNGSTFLTRDLAARSDVWVEGPLFMVASYSCEGKIS